MLEQLVLLVVYVKLISFFAEEQSNLSLDSGPQTPEDSTAFQEMQNCFTDKAEPSSASSPPGNLCYILIMCKVATKDTHSVPHNIWNKFDSRCQLSTFNSINVLHPIVGFTAHLFCTEPYPIPVVKLLISITFLSLLCNFFLIQHKPHVQLLVINEQP